MHLSFFFKKIQNYFRNRLTYVMQFYKPVYLTKSYPTFLSIEVSSRCNLHCPECPIGQGHSHRKNASLSFEIYEKLLKEIGPTLQTLIFYFQGEPLVNVHLEKYIQLAHTYSIFTQTSTNGQLLTQERAKQLVASGLHKLIISIDGITQESYEKYRIGGSIEKCFQAIQWVQQEKEKTQSKFPIIEAQMLVFKYNENERKLFKKKMKNLGANQVTFKSAQIYDFEKKTDLIPTQKRYARYVQKNGKWCSKYPIKNKCLRQWSGAVITSDATVLPCCYDKDQRYILGHLEHDSFQKIWCSTKAQKFRQAIHQHQNQIEMCQNCLP